LSKRPYLIIPIETKVRELDAKTFLACSAAEAGFRAILGEQASLLRRLALIPSGFYLDKSVARRKVASFRRLRAMGFRVLACCEEGLVYRDREAYLNERVAPEAFRQVERMFSWGAVQFSDISSAMPGAESRLCNTGNPRFDLLRPELRSLYQPAADALRKQLGAYLLINTNFGRYNHYYGQAKLKRILLDRGLLSREEEKSFYDGWVSFIGEVFDSFAGMLPRLAKAYPDHTIVLRPHPSENREVWRRIAANLPNVRVLSEGQVIPWILGAELSIHNSCTTGLEAALLGKPVFTYRPVKSEIYDSFLPNRVSVEADSPTALIDAVAVALNGSYRAPLETDPSVRADVERYVCSLTGPLATDRILTQIARLSAPQPTRGASLAYRLGDHAKQLVKGVARRTLAPLRSSGGYARQKFPGLSLDEVQDLANHFRSITGKFSSVTIRAWHGGLMMLESN
jgi:surface carbohydrate biosynthesis protein